jgi:hypothetical protein
LLAKRADDARHLELGVEVESGKFEGHGPRVSARNEAA